MAPNLSRCATLCLLSTTFISCYYAGIAAQDRPERSAAGPPTATDVVVRTEPWHLVHIPDPVARRATIAALETTSTRLCLLYTSPSPRDRQKSRMPSSA